MKKTQSGSFATGLVVGLLIGLGVALAVALYITKAPVPFIDKLPQRSAEQDAAEVERNRAWDPNAPLAGKNPARPGALSSGAVGETPAPAAAAVPPSQRDPGAILSGQPPAVALQAPRQGANAPPGTAFFVQAGAYARAEDADAQRAKLALMGLTAKVSEREQSGRTVHRVRLGPYDGREAAEDAQSRLAGAGIESNLVRVER